MIHYRTAAVGEHQIFYRQAGDPNQTSLLLLHGFPSSSHMFRNLIPLLSDRFHIVAPDLPGFGFSQSPPRSQFKYTFDNLATVIEAFTEVVRLQRCALYLQRLSYSSWRRHQRPVSLRPLGARSSHWYTPKNGSTPRA